MIDIDILFFGDAVVETESLTIPHSQLHLRNFVLQPMVDIAPEYRHPLLGASMIELLNVSEDTTKLQELG
jgi:2-amino-4-hydroxy-6-hydroxymethyldihydropteridine diphosphokinase